MTRRVMPKFDQISIVGVGLLGGSIALAARQQQIAGRVVGVGRKLPKLQQFVAQGMLDEATDDLATGVGSANLVVVCTPVQTIAAVVGQIYQHAPTECLITDVGSTKSQIVAAVANQQPDNPGRFVGSHPLAGDHRTGASHSRADLLADRCVVVTPGAGASDYAMSEVSEFWSSLGARVVPLSPEAHDQAIAVTSHLPHAVAAALAAATPTEALPFTATGWCDTTRVAAADTKLWRQIFLSNREQVLAAVDQFDQHWAKLRAALESADEQQLEALLTEGKQKRDALAN